MIKAIFFDIDGTLTSFRTRQVPEAVFNDLKLLKEKGIRLFVATGRGKDGLGVLKGFPFDGYITLNGQYCFIDDETVLYENTIDEKDLKVLLEDSENEGYPCGYTMPDEKIFNMRNHLVDEIHAITNNDDHPAGDVSNVASKKVYQVMAFISEEKERELMQKLPNCTAARWHPYFTDISPVGGTKVKGIDIFLKHYGIDLNESMAFGDGGNDLEMLKHVAVAVAMKDSPDKVLEVVDHVTDGPEDGGIHKALIHYGLI